MRSWSDCVVTLIDLIDIKELAGVPTTEASEKMRAFHQLVANRSHHLLFHQHVYAWNDAAAFVARIDNPDAPRHVLQELDELKRLIDEIQSSYAISVKGQVFPEPLHVGEASSDIGAGTAKFQFLHVSSFAFANCFLIEKALGALEKRWYVDARLRDAVKDAASRSEHAVSLLPGGRKRKVLAFSNYLWTSATPG